MTDNTYKYTFTMEEFDEDGQVREVKHSIGGEQTWKELLPHIADWLKGIGYVFDGTLTIE